MPGSDGSGSAVWDRSVTLGLEQTARFAVQYMKNYTREASCLLFRMPSIRLLILILLVKSLVYQIGVVAAVSRFRIYRDSYEFLFM